MQFFSIIKNKYPFTLANYNKLTEYQFIVNHFKNVLFFIIALILSFYVAVDYCQTISSNQFDIETISGVDRKYVTSVNYYDYKSNKLKILSAHVIENIERSKSEGILHTGGYLRQVSPEDDQPYFRNPVSQYLVFSWLATFFNDFNQLYSLISDSLACLFALAIASLCLLVKKKYDFITAAFLLYGLLGTNYLVYYSTSFYFIGFTYLLPFLVVMAGYGVGRSRVNIWLLFAVFVVCFLRGMLIFEHITIIISSMVIPVLMESRVTLARRIRDSVRIIAVGILGFIVSLIIHFIRLWVHLGSVEGAITQGFEKVLVHSGLSGGTIFSLDYWRQWDGQFSSGLFTFYNPFIFLSSVEWSSLTFHKVNSSLGIALNMYDFFLPILLVGIVCLVGLKLNYFSDKKLLALLFACPFALLSSLSWGVVMSHHNSLPYHLTLNSIALAVPFALIVYMLVGRFVFILIPPKISKFLK